MPSINLKKVNPNFVYYIWGTLFPKPPGVYRINGRSMEKTQRTAHKSCGPILRPPVTVLGSLPSVALSPVQAI